MSAPQSLKDTIRNAIIEAFTSTGLYIVSANDNVRFFGEDRYTVPLSASPIQTSGSFSPLEAIADGIIDGVYDYVSLSATEIGDKIHITDDSVEFDVSVLKLGNIYIYTGSSQPNFTANKGSIYLRDSVSTSATFYVNERGTSVWTLK